MLILKCDIKIKITSMCGVWELFWRNLLRGFARLQKKLENLLPVSSWPSQGGRWSTLYKYCPKKTLLKAFSLLNFSNFDQMGGHRWLLGVFEPRSTKVFLSVPTLQVKALGLCWGPCPCQCCFRRKNTCHWICHNQHFPCNIFLHKEEV